jgi:hypothetical protein
MNKNIAAGVYKAQDSPPFSQEAPQHSDLSRTTREQLYGKDYGVRTPPISEFLDECNTFSDVAAVVAATEQSEASLALVLSVSTRPAPHPSFGGATENYAAGIAHCGLQPTPGLSYCDGQAIVPPFAAPTTPSPSPLMLALLTGLSFHNVGQRRWFRPPEMHIVLSNPSVRSLPRCRLPS